MNAKETKEVWSDEEDLFAFNDKSTIYYLTQFLLKLDWCPKSIDLFRDHAIRGYPMLDIKINGWVIYKQALV